MMEVSVAEGDIDCEFSFGMQWMLCKPCGEHGMKARLIQRRTCQAGTPTIYSLAVRRPH